MAQGDIFLLYYIKVVNPRLTGEVRVGDVVQAGVVISNSETGLGAVNIQPLVYRLACLNGMVVNDTSTRTRRNHVGRAMSAPMIKCKKTPRKKCRFMAERREKR